MVLGPPDASKVTLVLFTVLPRTSNAYINIWGVDRQKPRLECGSVEHGSDLQHDEYSWLFVLGYLDMDVGIGKVQYMLDIFDINSAVCSR